MLFVRFRPGDIKHGSVVVFHVNKLYRFGDVLFYDILISLVEEFLISLRWIKQPIY